MDIRAIVRGGDRCLHKWIDPAIQPGDDRPFDVKAGYEDRQEWVRDVLTASTQEELIRKCGDHFAGVVAVIVGQEECRASGFPIRYVQVAVVAEPA